MSNDTELLQAIVDGNSRGCSVSEFSVDDTYAGCRVHRGDVPLEDEVPELEDDRRSNTTMEDVKESGHGKVNKDAHG